MQHAFQKIQFNYSKLRGKIKEHFDTQEEFAKVLSISSASLSSKLNNNVEFSQTEICKSVELLNLTLLDIPDYFFTLLVQEIEQ